MRVSLTVLLLLVNASFLSAQAQQNYDLSLRSHISYAPNTGSNVWGYVDSTGHEYALMGTSFGVSIVDVANPDSPKVLFNVNTSKSEWREIKTYKHYAYATNETDSGVLIIDLSGLPNKVSQSTFSYVPELATSITRSHTLWIDENGRLYLFGSNIYQFGTYTGALIFDLTQDPLHPKFLGNYTPNSGFYIHDGFVRGDTLWASEIYDGNEEVIDLHDPAHGESLAIWPTTSFFTHNSAPTHNDHYVFTTDEVPGSFLTAYDVHDLSNVTAVDRIQHNPGTNPIIHNVHLLNDSFAVCSYYTEGVLIYDVTFPNNMVEVGHYDLYPANNGGFFNGTWGVYPYLPSHNILASNIEAGLYVLTPQYKHAWWLTGNVIDSSTRAPIFKADIKVLGTTAEDSTDLFGDYKTGFSDSGTFDIQITKPRYYSKTFYGVRLENGKLTNLSAALIPVSTFNASLQIVDSATNQPLDSINVYASDNNGLNYTLQTMSDENGMISLPNLYPGNYSVVVGKWGYETKQISIDADSSHVSFEDDLSRKYYDDFSFDYGWKVSGNATSGIWVRGIPVGTFDKALPINPGSDVSDDYLNQCFVTGNGGGDMNFDDVDNGETILTSPVLDLSNYIDPVISYERWYVDKFGVGQPNDTMQVWISNGTEEKLVENLTAYNTLSSSWVHYSFHVKDFLTPTGEMTLMFKCEDQSDHDNTVEGGVDKFEVSGDLISGVNTVSKSNNVSAKCIPSVFSNQCMLQFNLDKNFNECHVEIVNALGEVMMDKKVNVNDRSMIWGNGLPEGLYHLIIFSNGSVIATTSAIKINE